MILRTGGGGPEASFFWGDGNRYDSHKGGPHTLPVAFSGSYRGGRDKNYFPREVESIIDSAHEFHFSVRSPRRVDDADAPKR